MPILCALSDGKKTVIGSDLTRWNGSFIEKWHSSWWMKGEFALGTFEGNYIVDNLIDEHFEELISNALSKQKESKKKLDGDAKIVPFQLPINPFYLAMQLRNMLMEYEVLGAPSDEGAGFEGYNQTFLLAMPGVIWRISSSFGVLRLTDNKVHVNGGGDSADFFEGIGLSLIKEGRYAYDEVLRKSLEYASQETIDVCDKNGFFIKTLG